MNLLAFRAVRKSYGAIEALRGVDLRVKRGSVVALLGPNGAGKSTLFGCLLGTVRPDSGEILFQGEPVTPQVRARLGYLAERVALYQDRTVLENARFITRLKGIDPADVDSALDRLNLRDLRGRKVSQLSKGQLQRAALAIALCGRPELLVLDEPFNGLDPVVLDAFIDIVREEQERGVTVLISTHTISAAEEIATDVSVLLDGRMALSAPLEEIREQYSCRSLEAVYHEIAKGMAREPKELVAT
jgi:ABC-type multidrug transport system ATPase subunit